MISVVVCTYNRASLLDEVLGSLTRQDFEGEYEIVVVDNRSTDGTPDVVAKWRERAGVPVHYILETRQGLSYARNMGADRSRGEVIAYIDDDAVAGARWLANMARVFDERPDVTGIGGPVVPRWDGEPPGWLFGELLDVFAVGERGPEPFLMKGKVYPFGVNCAVRRCVFEGGIAFRPDLGRIGESLLSCEEVEFFHRIRADGGRLLYAPDVVVYHHVPGARMTRDYVRQRRYWDGRSIAVWDRTRGGLWLEWRNALLRLAAVIIRDAPVFLWLGARAQTDRAFTYACRFAKTRGYIKQTWIDLRSALSTGKPSSC
jgi:glycosyltransferase involved in cell wall biosynthesis